MSRRGMSAVVEFVMSFVLILIVIWVAYEMIYGSATSAQETIDSLGDCDAGVIGSLAGQGGVCKCFDNPRCEGTGGGPTGWYAPTDESKKINPFNGEKAWKWQYLGDNKFGCPPEKDRSDEDDVATEKARYVYACVTVQDGKQIPLLDRVRAECEATPPGTWKFVTEVQGEMTCLDLNKASELGVAADKQFGFRYFPRTGESSCSVLLYGGGIVQLDKVCEQKDGKYFVLYESAKLSFQNLDTSKDYMVNVALTPGTTTQQTLKIKKTP